LESKAKEAANKKGSKDGQDRAMEAAHGQMGERTRGREVVERELEAFLMMKEREELEKEQAALQQEHIRARQAMTDLRESIVEEKESLSQERMQLAGERAQIALVREQLRKKITGALSRQAIVYSKKMCKQAFFCRWLRVGLVRQQKAAPDDFNVLQQNEVTFEHQPHVLVDSEYQRAKGKRQQRRVARMWASAKVRLKDKMLLMLVSSRWNLLAARSSRR
jgi:DNA gyrase/topoisomerase IV subunit A